MKTVSGLTVVSQVWNKSGSLCLWYPTVVLIVNMIFLPSCSKWDSLLSTRSLHSTRGSSFSPQTSAKYSRLFPAKFSIGSLLLPLSCWFSTIRVLCIAGFRCLSSTLSSPMSFECTPNLGCRWSCLSVFPTCRSSDTKLGSDVPPSLALRFLSSFKLKCLFKYSGWVASWCCSFSRASLSLLVLSESLNDGGSLPLSTWRLPSMSTRCTTLVAGTATRGPWFTIPVCNWSVCRLDCLGASLAPILPSKPNPSVCFDATETLSLLSLPKCFSCVGRMSLERCSCGVVPWLAVCTTWLTVWNVAVTLVLFSLLCHSSVHLTVASDLVNGPSHLESLSLVIRSYRTHTIRYSTAVMNTSRLLRTTTLLAGRHSIVNITCVSDKQNNLHQSRACGLTGQKLRVWFTTGNMFVYLFDCATHWEVMISASAALCNTMQV